MHCDARGREGVLPGEGLGHGGVVAVEKSVGVLPTLKIRSKTKERIFNVGSTPTLFSTATTPPCPSPSPGRTPSRPRASQCIGSYPTSCVKARRAIPAECSSHWFPIAG